MIDEARAREIAAEWHSPSPHSDQISRLSHGMPVTDWPRLHDQVAREVMEAPEPIDRLYELLEWIEDAHPTLWKRPEI